MGPKISIALCTYNGSKYLSSQLESYLTQTYLPDEVVVCDDCSQDETVAILNGFAGRAPFPVRILVNDRNIGSTKNFERAISLCSGDIVLLSDQDDVWAANKIERVLNEFDSNDEVGMVFSDAELVDESLQPLGRNLLDGRFTWKEREIRENGNLFSILLKKYIVTGATLAFRAKYSNVILPIPTEIPNMIHDRWIAVILSIIVKSIFLNEPLIKYRQHSEQQIGSDVTRYVPGVFKLAWGNALERVEKKHKSEKECIELLKNHITSRIDVPAYIMNTVNVEIQYQQEYAQHYQLRKELSDNYMMRLWPIIKELLSGRYHRFSNGIRSAARDFIVDHARVTEYHEIIDKRKTVID